jgi:hypothetical protein
MRFDAETSAFIQKVMSAKNALSETEKKMNDVGNAAKGSSKNLDDMGSTQGKIFGSFKSDVTSMITGYLSIGAAIQGVQKIHAIFDKDLNDTLTRTKKSVSEMGATAAGLGLQAHLPEIRRKLHQPEAMPGMDIASRDALFDAIAKRMPGADYSDIVQMTLAAGEGKRLGFGENIQSLGQTMAYLSDMLPGQSPEQLRNRATQLMPHLGGQALSEQNKAAFLKFRDLGVGTDSQGLGMLASFGQTGENAKFGSFVEALAAPTEKTKRGKAATLKDKFAAMTAQERFEALDRDPGMAMEVLGGTGGAYVTASKKYRDQNMEIKMMHESQAFEARSAEYLNDPLAWQKHQLDKAIGVKETRKERDAGRMALHVEAENERNYADANPVSAATAAYFRKLVGAFLDDKSLTPAYPDRPKDSRF